MHADAFPRIELGGAHCHFTFPFIQPAEQGEYPDFCYKKSEGSRSVFYAL